MAVDGQKLPLGDHQVGQAEQGVELRLRRVLGQAFVTHLLNIQEEVLRINAFEGARRVLLLLLIFWTIGVVAVTWERTPYIAASFSVNAANAPPVRMKEDDYCNHSDAEKKLSRHTKSGKRVSVTLCFKSQELADRRAVIPYKVDPAGRWWGNASHTDDVTRYIASYGDRFQLTDDMDKWVEQRWRDERWSQVKEGVLFLFGGWMCLWLLGAVIGWIVRGFAGIPTGKDSRTAD